ncbi:MAG: class A beta-lactamase-related serine hydrolase [Gemmatimonadetes bacterium]|nr:class A beta-lactamase-related serine hydrolase [Gemmatimonadota bacterium]
MGAERAEELRGRIDSLAEAAGARRVAAAFHDYESGDLWDIRGDEWFHAASTIKVPVLVGVFAAVEDHDLTIDSRVHVRNQFYSVVDGAPYRIDSSRDANSEVHSTIGKTMKLSRLAHHMIVTSSNLATNLLIDAVGLDRVQRTLDQLGIEGVELRRGVEDERAYEEGIINRVTANGLVQVLRLIEEKQAISAEACERMLEILHDQEFRSGIPAGLPDDARVANKTGEISTVAHDTGLVYLKGRKPYSLAILTEWDAGKTSGRRDTLAKISRAVYEHLTGTNG